MTKVDELIAKFKEFKEELNKNVNNSYSMAPNATTGTSGGQGGMYRSEGQDMMAMAEVVKFDKNGQWKLDKKEGQNEKANPTQPHNKGKFKVEPMAPEKESKKEDVKGKPYNGKDKDVHKGEKQENKAKGFEENSPPGRGTLGV